MASSSSGSHPAWHYNTQAYPSPYHTFPYPPNAHDAGAQAAQYDFHALRGDQRLLAVVQHAGLLNFDTLNLLESKYRGKDLRRWAASFVDTFGHADGVEEALNIVMRNAGIQGDVTPFISNLVSALRDAAQPAQPASAQPTAAVAAARGADPPQPATARERLQSWLQSPVVAEIDDAKRRRIIHERALITEFPMRTPEARDAWAERFCQGFFPQKQEFFMEDANALLREVVAGFGVTGPEAIDREVSRLAQALSKVGVCNAKHRTSKRLRPAQTRIQ